jgi:SAM-dependent methyltransferase
VLRHVPYEVLNLIERGSHTEALEVGIMALEPENTRTRWRRGLDICEMLRFPFSTRLRRREGQILRATIMNGENTFGDVIRRLRSPAFADYLVVRQANPSFLAGVALMMLLRPVVDAHAGHLGPCARPTAPRVLDLGCGTAQASFLMTQLYPEISVVACDHDFLNLLIASRYIVPNADFVCTDGEAPLPFARESFDAVFCLDAFHYIRSKAALAREMMKVVARDGLILLPHLHNARESNPTPGVPLTADAYARCFEPANARLFSEPILLDQLCRKHTIDLRNGTNASELAAANAFALVATHREDVWGPYPIRRTLMRSDRNLTLNPIYRTERNGDLVQLVRHWPNDALAMECRQSDALLPPKVTLKREFLTRTLQRMNTPEDRPILELLAESFVFIHLPNHYLPSASIPR